MTNLQTKMQRALDEAVAQGRERGVQLVAYYRGERVVDAWSGIADIRTGLVTPDGVVHELGLGYDLGGPNNVTGPHATSFGHGGYGGSLAYADPESRLAVAYANNLFSSQCARDEIVALLKRELGIGETPVEQKNGIGG